MNALHSTTTPDNLIALPNGLASDATGLVTWWQLSGNTDHAALADAWAGEGLDADWLLSLPSPKVALTRAVDEVIRGNAKRKKHHVADAHWMVYDVDADERHGATFNEELHAKLNDDRTDIVVTPSGHPLEAEMRESFRANQTRLESRDIGTWLSTKIMPALNAVSLRERGGVDFVMRDQVAMFHRIKAAIRKVSAHLMFEMQALRNDEAVEAILHAINAEAEAQAEEVEAALDANDIGGRGFRTKHKQCDAMLDKVEAYEKLLDRKLDEMRAKLTDLSAASAEAAIMADAKAAEERASKKNGGADK